MGKAKGSSKIHRAYSPKAARQKEDNTKRRGELAELAFLYKAANLGFGVAKPYGDSERYDFILDSPQDFSEEQTVRRLWRVQVKSTTTLLNGLYRINAYRRTVGRAVPYQPSEVDFLAAYIIPEDAWFIFPIHAILDRTSILLAPGNWPRPRTTDPYREAWSLFRANRATTEISRRARPLVVPPSG